jgi:hypothetical protein
LADLIAAGINHLPTPSPEALSEVMKEFKGFFALPGTTPETQRLEEKPIPKPPAPKRSYSILMYERPQVVAFIISLLPEEERRGAINSLPREKATVEELLLGLRKNPLSPKLEAEIKKIYKDKIFVEASDGAD